MARKTPAFEIFQSSGDLMQPAFYWRLRGRNGRIAMTGGESFTRRASAVKAVKRVKELATAAVVVLK